MRVLALLLEIAFNSRTQNVTRFDGSRINIAVGIVEKPLRMSSNGRHRGGERRYGRREREKKEFEECQE